MLGEATRDVLCVIALRNGALVEVREASSAARDKHHHTFLPRLARCDLGASG